MVQRHDGKSCADHNSVYPADGDEQRGVFFMSESQALEGALEAMDQVDA